MPQNTSKNYLSIFLDRVRKTLANLSKHAVSRPRLQPHTLTLSTYQFLCPLQCLPGFLPWEWSQYETEHYFQWLV